SSSRWDSLFSKVFTSSDKSMSLFFVNSFSSAIFSFKLMIGFSNSNICFIGCHLLYYAFLIMFSGDVSYHDDARLYQVVHVSLKIRLFANHQVAFHVWSVQ